MKSRVTDKVIVILHRAHREVSASASRDMLDTSNEDIERRLDEWCENRLRTSGHPAHAKFYTKTRHFPRSAMA